MMNALKKFVFYGMFCALGVYWAEVISTNLPYAAVNPFAYLAYGLLYVIFIDILMRYDIKDFKVWYMFGALVGLITETYLAKVTFYGADMNTTQIGGFAPAAIAFILLFYHAFFSFLAPCYVGKHVLKMPLNLPKKKWADFALYFGPMLLMTFFAVKGGGAALAIFQGSLVSGFTVLVWILIMKGLGDIEDVRLSGKARKILYGITVLIYGLFFCTTSNIRAHGHLPLDVPVPALIITTMFVLGIFFGLGKYLAKRKEVSGPISYTPSHIAWKTIVIWAGAYYSSFLIFIVLVRNLPFVPQIIQIAFALFAVCGMGIGVFLFSRALYVLVFKPLLNR